MGGGAARGAPTLYFDMRHTAISSTLIHRQAADALLNNTRYISRLMDLNELMGQLIEKAKSEGAIRKDLPTEVVLFTVYARSCDPTLDYLRVGDQYTDDQVIHFLLTTCFDGLH